ncbi:hypothetical protein GOP47_0029134 [Adiantum capillus-veneris]|nr:hypothetical protein GOP47_0029134 [Adiantum capillus-veneris]
MAGVNNGQKRRVDMTTPSNVLRQQRENRRAQQQKTGEAEWLQCLVPVFGVTAAAAIAIYMRNLKEARKRTIAVKKEHPVSKKSMKLVDLSLVANNGILVKSRSAFV